MPRLARTLPIGLGDTFSVAEAVAAGVTAGRLRAADLEQPFRGVRLTAEPEHPEQPEGERSRTKDEIAQAETWRIARACAKVIDAHAFFAGRTAAVLRSLPVEPGADLVVAVKAPGRPPRRKGIIAIKVAPKLAHVQDHEGLRMTTPATTWAMLGAELSVRELVAVGDAIVRVPRDKQGELRPEEQLATPAHLERAVAAGRRVGIAKLREALALIRVGSASPLETDFRIDAAQRGLPEPKLDMDIYDRHGKRIGITEVVYPEFRIAVEIEGDHHRIDRRQWNRDIEKYASYVAEGWEVVRLTSQHIRGARPRAVGIVRDVLVRRGWRPD